MFRFPGTTDEPSDADLFALVSAANLASTEEYLNWQDSQWDDAADAACYLRSLGDDGE